jgi:hypothetical protein
MKFKLPISLSNLDAASDDFVKYVSQAVDLFTTIINGEVDFRDNCKTTIAKITFSSADMEQAVEHSLGRIPYGYIMIGSLAATQIYNGVSQNTTKALYVRSSVATTVSFLIF